MWIQCGFQKCFQKGKLDRSSGCYQAPSPPRPTVCQLGIQATHAGCVPVAAQRRRHPSFCSGELGREILAGSSSSAQRLKVILEEATGDNPAARAMASTDDVYLESQPACILLLFAGLRSGARPERAATQMLRIWPRNGHGLGTSIQYSPMPVGAVACVSEGVQAQAVVTLTVCSNGARYTYCR
jgi:hypothetical protein